MSVSFGIRAVQRAARGRGGVWLALILCSVQAPGWAAERWSIVSSGETVGYLEAKADGDRVDVDYHVDNNGRGAKHREQVVLDANGLPIRWQVKGTSEMGGAVEETFAWNAVGDGGAGTATWRSQADQGSRELPAPIPYIVNDRSPWATGVYARLLLARPDRELEVLPGGRMRLQELRRWQVPGSTPVDTTVYRLTGLDLTPIYLMLDAQRQLFAEFTAESSTVRAGYEAQAAALQGLAGELDRQRARELQQALAHRYAQPVRLINVHVFDPRSGTRGPRVSVVFHRDRITAVDISAVDISAVDAAAAAKAGGEKIFDAQGGTLVPGLHDMHSHTTLDSGLWYLAAGVTATRDMGNDNDFLLDLLPRIESGEIAGPRIVANGFLEGRSPYSARVGFIPESLPQALQQVRWYADRGYWQIKIYNSMNPDWVQPIAAEAHRRGMGVAGHIPAFTTPDRMIRDGYDEVTHLNQLVLGWVLSPKEDTRTPLRLTAMTRLADLDLDSPKVQQTLALMKQRGTALDPTAVILERLMLSRAGEVAEGDRPFLEHMPIGYQRYRKRTYVPDLDAATDRAYHRSVAAMLALLKRLHDQGTRLLPGTDDATGFTVHRELELYVKAGIPAAQALRIGTLGAEEHLGRAHELGSIERGKGADFFLVDGDPTRDIGAIRKPRMVVKAGTVYFPSEIYTALGVTPFAAPPPSLSP